jgi:hypothetical protein
MGEPTRKEFIMIASYILPQLTYHATRREITDVQVILKEHVDVHRLAPLLQDLIGARIEAEQIYQVSNTYIATLDILISQVLAAMADVIHEAWGGGDDELF